MGYPLRGLRYRLTAVFLIAFGVFLAGLGAGVAWFQGRNLQRDIDRQLRQTILAARELYAADLGEFPTMPAVVAHILTELIYPDRTIVAFGQDGRLIGRSRRFSGAPALETPGRAGAYRRPTTILTGGERARALEDTLPGSIRLVVALSLAPLERQREALGLALALGLPLLLLTGTILGGFLARRALQPIAEVAEAAKQVGGLASEGHQVFPPIPERAVADEVGELTTEFNRLLHRLGQALRRERAAFARQRDFLQDAAHELRTPIAIVRSEAEAALAGPRNPELDAHALDVIAGEAQRMGTAVGDLLLLARSETPTAAGDRARLFLDDVAAKVLARMQKLPAAQGRSIQLGEFESAPVWANEALVERAVVCLVENALAHAAPAAIELSTGRRAAGAGGVWSWLQVRDWGPGIPLDQAERVFERFVRISPGVPGSGLGLAIARWIAESHGGTLTLQHPSGGGAASLLELPAPPELSVAPAGREESAPASSPQTSASSPTPSGTWSR